MTQSKKAQSHEETVMLEERKRYKAHPRATIRIQMPRYAPPQLYAKMLVGGAQIIKEAFENNAPVNIFMHFVYTMEKHNFLRVSIEEIAASANVSYQYASILMSKLVQAKLLCRTGTRSKWMINPYVATKCSEEESKELQNIWNGFHKEEKPE